MSDAAVTVRSLTRRFGDFTAVNGVSFDIPRGKVFGFLGPNGSGKSTTIRMLTGLLAPTAGTVTGLGGLDVVRDTDRWKTRLGYMSQKFSLYLDLTVEENLRFFGAAYGLSNARLPDRIGELSERLGFSRLRRDLTESLSTGWRQRVALAASLLHEPELLFLDEPTGGVDPKGRRIFWDLIYELAAGRGMTVLVTTHYMDEAEQCDRLAFLLEGELIAEGTPPDLKEGAGRPPLRGGRRMPSRSRPSPRSAATPRSRMRISSARGCGPWRAPAPESPRCASSAGPAPPSLPNRPSRTSSSRWRARGASGGAAA